MECSGCISIRNVSDLYENFELLAQKNIFLRKIYGYSTIDTDDAVFFIGGKDPESRDIIAQFKDWKWSKLSYLKQPRHYHASIKMKNQIVIFGGETDGK